MKTFKQFVETVLLEETRNAADFSNPNEFYRIVVGDEAFNDIVQSGQVRTVGSPTYKGANFKPVSGINLSGRSTAFPSFSRGSINMTYANNNPNHYVISTTDGSLKPSTSGRHGKGTTHFPTDDQGNKLGSLAAGKVKVYKHMGDGRYELVYPNPPSS